MPLTKSSLQAPAAAESPAFWVSTQPLGESDALVRFFTEHEGALTVRARGLLKPHAKLAPQLQPAALLAVTTATSRGRSRVLTSVRTLRAGSGWNGGMRPLALAWFMLECGFAGSGPAPLNSAVFSLLDGVFSAHPADGALYSLATAFSLRLLSLHGLLTDLECDAIDGQPLGHGDPAFMLPSGEGLISVGTYNRHYARTGSGLVRLDSGRRTRWVQVLMQPLDAALEIPCDEVDAALAVGELGRRMADAIAQPLRTVEFLKSQWKLPRRSDLARASK
jgi:recombinational DNA repair protein (RecF pathway)